MGDDTATVIASASGVAERVMDERPIDDSAADGAVLAAGTAEDGATENGAAGDVGAGDGAADKGAAGEGAAGQGAAAKPGQAARPSLSPSRAGDFLTCPLLYRFRVIDRLPEPPSPAAARGTLVHAVLERLFDAPAAGRTSEAARALLEPEWARLVAAEPDLAGLFDGELDR